MFLIINYHNGNIRKCVMATFQEKPHVYSQRMSMVPKHRLPKIWSVVIVCATMNFKAVVCLLKGKLQTSYFIETSYNSNVSTL